MKKWQYTIFLLVLMVLPCGYLFADSNSFSIFLNKGRHSYFNSTVQKNLENFAIEEEPVITLDDIVFYYQNTNEIQLTKEAYERFAKIRILDCPFVVCVGEKRVYSGVLVSMANSASFSGIVIVEPNIWAEAPKASELIKYEDWNWQYENYRRNQDHIIKLHLSYPGYPDERNFRGVDSRSDPRILSVFERAGKLRTRISTPNKIIFFFGTISPWFEYQETWELIFVAGIVLALVVVLMIWRKRKRKV